MKRLLLYIVCLTAIMAASTSLKAQEVTIVLTPGWTWISNPSTDTLDFATALGSFTPMAGDAIKSQWGNAYYRNGRWAGSISQFYPGYGYKYYSNRTVPVLFTMGTPLPQLSVTTAEPTDITTISAVVGSTVTIGEGNHLYARGVCWGTEEMPDVDGSHTNGEAVAGSQGVTLDGLTSGTTYYVRAYMVTDYGLAYGNEVSFTTIPIWTIEATPNPTDGGTITGMGDYEQNAVCTLTAIANEGYFFESWTENGQEVSVDASYTFSVYGDRNLTANFYATMGNENVVNGDFEQGNTGFTTSYLYNSNLLDEGTYFVDYDASLHRENFHGLGHGGSGKFMIVNGATTSGTNVWTEQIGVVPNTYYVFSTWVCTVADGSPALLQFLINGFQLGDVFSAPSQTNVWQRFYVQWYSGSATDATITILNQNSGVDGNDFGLDDISFREIDSVQGEIPEGAINGKFTINADGDQVYFSQGNLQYQASTDTWKFADNQYDYVGSDNSNISSTYSGWIDLFGWGTSGYHATNDPYNVNYQPWSTSNPPVNSSYNYWGYGPSTNMTDPNLTGTSANYDWGVYNPISNGGNQTNQWRTLTQPEWNYVFNTRTTTSGIRYAKAKVNNVNGVILLPDEWSSNTYNLSNTNSSDVSFGSNTLTASQWSTLEQAGAVFLPSAGGRHGISVTGGSSGVYWSASYYGIGDAYCVCFDVHSLYYVDVMNDRYVGQSVRLVRVAEN